MDAEPWYAKRRRELEAALPVKRKRKTAKFAMVRLDWAARAAKATRTPKALVLVRLEYLRWEHKGRPFQLPNKWLEHEGVSRFVKNRTLNELVAGGLIALERHKRKSPLVTVL